MRCGCERWAAGSQASLCGCCCRVCATSLNRKGPDRPMPAGPLSHPEATHRLGLSGMNIDYCVVRSKRKTIALLITPKGLEVRAPRWVSLTQIKEAIEEREAWIIKQFDFMSQKLQEARQGEIEIKDGCVSRVFGHQVQWIFKQKPVSSGEKESSRKRNSQSRSDGSVSSKRTNTKRLQSPLEHIEIECLLDGVWSKLSFEDWAHLLMTKEPLAPWSTRIALPIRELFQELETLEKNHGVLAPSQNESSEHPQRPQRLAVPQGLGWHKQCAKVWMDALHQRLLDRVARQRVAHYAALLGVNPTSLSFGQAKHRWGSAGSNGAIRLNVHLVHVPLPLLDYVVLHELSHLKHMNHSAAFWNCVAQGMPDYVQRKEQLKKVVMPLWV